MREEALLKETTIRTAAQIAGPGGHPVTPRVRGRPTGGGRWEGWMEFVSSTGEPILRIPARVETRTRGELLRWAAGLTEGHLAEALDAALSPEPPDPLPDP